MICSACSWNVRKRRRLCSVYIIQERELWRITPLPLLLYNHFGSTGTHKERFFCFHFIHVHKRFLGRKSIKHIDSKGQEEESNLRFALKHVRSPWSAFGVFKARGPTNKHTPTHNNYPLDISANIIISPWNIEGRNPCESVSIVSITRTIFTWSKIMNPQGGESGQAAQILRSF